jgi:hypothetical protein
MKKIILLFLLVSTYVTNAQVTAFPPDPIMLCDITNTGDGVETFDLTIRESQIINGQSNVNVTYHETSGDALSGTNPFNNPTSYVNIYNPQNVFVRVRSTANGSWDITTMEISVLETPYIDEEPNELIGDDPDGDGFATFDLTEVEPIILGPQDPTLLSINYFETYTDALNNINPIVNPTSYNNIINPQEVCVRMENLNTGCFVITCFLLVPDSVLEITESFSNSFSIFPNPAIDKVEVTSRYLISNVKINIYNLQGQTISSQNLLPVNNTAAINISALQEGVYIIKITTENNIVTKKIVIK